MLEKSVQDVGKMSSIELLRPMVYAIMEFYREPHIYQTLKEMAISSNFILAFVVREFENFQ